MTNIRESFSTHFITCHTSLFRHFSDEYLQQMNLNLNLCVIGSPAECQLEAATVDGRRTRNLLTGNMESPVVNVAAIARVSAA